MDKLIDSKALRANLDETSRIEYSIPEDHKWFISLSKDFWGINNRTKNFFNELHHPYSNRKDVIELLVSISITDFWICKNHKDRQKAIELLLDIFNTLLHEELPDELSKHLVFIYLEFFSKNFDSLTESDLLTEKYLEILSDNLDNNLFSYLSNISSFRKSLSVGAESEKHGRQIFELMKKLLLKNIDFWDKTSSIEEWYAVNKSKMSADYSETIESLGKNTFTGYRKKVMKAGNWNALCENLFSFSDIIDAFRQRISDFKRVSEQFAYIFYLLHLQGVVYHRDYLMMDLNNTIRRISNELDETQSIQAVDELFDLFSDFRTSHIASILDSLLLLGKELISTQNKNLIHYFEDKIISFGFVSPGITYLTNNWELKTDPNHIKNLRVWLELIEYDPETMKKILSALIINLRVGGIFIYDTDLFQKDVTRLLNSKISPIYKQIKQLTRIFPVYFNEIGAEGLLRDVTTRIDEMSHRNDKLIHFLRKQVHTEGNNTHIDITYKIILFWYEPVKTRLKDIIPANVYETIDAEGEWVTGVNEVLVKVCRKEKCSIDELIRKDLTEVSSILAGLDHDNVNDIKRVSLIIELYQLLKEKYLFETGNIVSVLRNSTFIEKKDIELLEKYMAEGGNVEALKLIFSFMIKLNNVIFDPAISEGWESIYYKRHIAFGIPSMYGQYREAKFEALGLTFRLEQIASTLMGKIIAGINTDYFTARTLKDIFSVLELLKDGLSLDGIYDQSFDSNLKMLQYSLTSGSFSIYQYINIFQFMEANIKAIITKYFIRPYEQLLGVILPHYIGGEKTKNPQTIKKQIIRKSEVFYRELLSSAFLIQLLDNFLGRILNNLNKLVDTLSKSEIQCIMTYNPDLVISPLYTETPTLDNQVFIGSKAYYLKKLYLNNLPVPPGFVVSTEVFRRIKAILKVRSLNSEIDDLIKFHISELERITGLGFCNPEKPLLLSVRSGAAISMPGAMNTFLNVGLNDEITEKLSRQNNFGWTSWDCYRRLLQTWGMSHGLERNEFDQIIINFKNKYNIKQKIDFTPQTMREIAFEYKRLLETNNIEFEEDPFLQVRKAIISVFRSWDTPRAEVYRKHMRVADEWGTAVIVQQMIFGNLHKESGSGVLFTHDSSDSTNGVNLNGDFSFHSQGEDIVSGLISTLPVSELQRQKYYSKSPFSLETNFPFIYGRLKEIAEELIEKHGFGHQEIEFTFETSDPKDLYILQTRDMAIVRQDVIEVFAKPESEMKKLGSGIGIGNKVLNGVIVFDSDDLTWLKKNEPDKNAILVRPDTVPDDIEMIFECEGLLTSKGGSTSHAAVTAATLGKICVVNCYDMTVYEKEKKCVINGESIYSFDKIAIDGNKGFVFKGNYPVKIQKL